MVLAEDKAAGVLVLEDLGDTDLWSLAQGPAFPWAPVASALEQVAGTITSNLRHDGGAHRSPVEGLMVDTGRRDGD